MSDAAKVKNRIFSIILIVIMLTSAVLTAFVYRIPVIRFLESCKDFGFSVAVFVTLAYSDIFELIFGYIPEVSSAAGSLPDWSRYSDYIGWDIDKLIAALRNLFDEVFNLLNFVEYNMYLSLYLTQALTYLMLLIPFITIILFIIKSCYFTEKETDPAEKSDPYQKLEHMALKLKPALTTVVDFFKYAYSNKLFLYSFVGIWLLNFGVPAMVMDFLSFYFYFAATFEVTSFVYLLVRWLLDSFITSKAMPAIVPIVTFGICYYLYQRSRALDRLRHNESKNCGVLKELELVILIVGEMGSGKTTLLTDMILSMVNIFKTDALKILYRIELLFPGFQFAALRADIIPLIASRDMTCRDHVVELVDRLLKDGYPYGYVTGLYKTSVDLGNRTMELRDALIIYGHAFMIYQNNNPVAANYSIRLDGEFDDSPYFKLWDGDFFSSHSESRYAHILNQDIMRFGLKIEPSSPFVGSFGYGIYANTEFAKARGNQHSNAAFDAADTVANPKNDLYEYSHMMSRHPNVTIEGNVFFKFISDEQRIGSLEAKLLQNLTVVEIAKKGDMQMALSGFFWLFWIRDYVCDPFEDLYLDYQNLRSDMTIALMLPKMLVSSIRLVCERLENTYGYKELTLVKRKGNGVSNDISQGTSVEYTYYLANMKVYAERFATDCYSQFFSEMQKKCKTNIEDYPTYKGLNMSYDEMLQQNDYFIMKLMNMTIGSPITGEMLQNVSNDPYENLIFEE